MGVFNAKAVERIGRYQAKRVQERPPEAPFGTRLSNEDTLKLSKEAAKNLMLAARMRGEEAAPSVEADYQEQLRQFEELKEYGRKQAEWSRRPLELQDTSDAWNERQRRVASGRMAAQILMRATMNMNKLKKKHESK
jgi:hypothetical protein